MALCTTSLRARRLGWAAFALAACAGPVNDTLPADRAEVAAADAAFAPSIGMAREVGFDHFCERTLLVRRPSVDAPTDLASAREWFGGLVSLREGDPVVAALPELLVAMHAREGAHGNAVEDASWPVARLLTLREQIGATAFVEGLREFVDRHRHGAPVGRAELIDALREQAPESVPAFADAWFANEATALVRVRHRYDASRDRVLVRVDQLHPIEDGAPDAFPFTLPLTLYFGDGRAEERHGVEVTLRRHLFEIPVDAEPSRVVVDPDRSLLGLVEFEEAAP